MFLNTIKSILSDNWPILIIFIITMVLVRFFYLRAHRERLSFYKMKGQLLKSCPFSVLLLLIKFKLTCIKLIIFALLLEKFIVVASLYYLAMLQNHNGVGVANS